MAWGEKKRFALLGERLSHSYSPEIHAFLGDYGYDLIEKKPEEVAAFIKNNAYGGLNVTIPYKRAAYECCDVLSEDARRAGSVNTIIKKPDGSLHGDNTDLFGFKYMASLAGADFRGAKVIVLGSGGASGTACRAASDGGAASVTVISRSGEDNYENISRHADADIIINTTPVGMYPNNGGRLIDIGMFGRCRCVLDMIYNPERTPLLLDAADAKKTAAGGLPMLVAQALRSAELFTGEPIGEEKIAPITAAAARRHRNIVLIGMPGSGKTTAARLTAEKLGLSRLDTDIEIERREGRSIPEIFASRGEDYFRSLEAEVIAQATKTGGKVISAGGGAVLRRETRDALRQNGFVIFLRRPLGALATEGRPLSKSLPELERMYGERLPLYLMTRDAEIENDAEAPVIADRIAALAGNR